MILKSLSLYTFIGFYTLNLPLYSNTTKFLNGINSETFYDINKDWDNYDQTMCGTVSGANVLNWWLASQGKTHLGSTEENAIFQYAKTQLKSAGKNNIDAANPAYAVWSWYIQGLLPTSQKGREFERNGKILELWNDAILGYNNTPHDPEITGTGSIYPGFYQDLAFDRAEESGINFMDITVQDEMNAIYSTYDMTYDRYEASFFRDQITNALNNNCGIVINIGAANVSNGTLINYHAINVWGADYDNAGNITHLYITNGDDFSRRMVKILVEDRVNSKSTPTIYEDGRSVLYIGNLEGLNTTSENMIYGIDIFNLSNITPIPEPMNMTLSLVGLCLFTLRRRR